MWHMICEIYCMIANLIARNKFTLLFGACSHVAPSRTG